MSDQYNVREAVYARYHFPDIQLQCTYKRYIDVAPDVTIYVFLCCVVETKAERDIYKERDTD